MSDRRKVEMRTVQVEGWNEPRKLVILNEELVLLEVKRMECSGSCDGCQRRLDQVEEVMRRRAKGEPWWKLVRNEAHVPSWLHEGVWLQLPYRGEGDPVMQRLAGALGLEITPL